eukprot:TRINITY_DN47100_c0_g1_i1.p1 TRINITY_DN47100_c0_g1~~TRINITY_DN47100_c0_g1_i1.p1  ORF type:complete len:364 (+),score=26.84 TRINITY_DN47100_c0_g1_i1:125-1216(+)
MMMAIHTPTDCLAEPAWDTMWETHSEPGPQARGREAVRAQNHHCRSHSAPAVSLSTQDGLTDLGENDTDEGSASASQDSHVTIISPPTPPAVSPAWHDNASSGSPPSPPQHPVVAGDKLHIAIPTSPLSVAAGAAPLQRPVLQQPQLTRFTTQPQGAFPPPPACTGRPISTVMCPVPYQCVPMLPMWQAGTPTPTPLSTTGSTPVCAPSPGVFSPPSPLQSVPVAWPMYMPPCTTPHNERREVRGSAPKTVFRGRIKSFVPDHGYGFIQCEEAHAIYRSDVFLHRAQYSSSGAQVGDTVEFVVEPNKNGRPQARDVRRVGSRPRSSVPAAKSCGSHQTPHVPALPHASRQIPVVWTSQPARAR